MPQHIVPMRALLSKMPEQPGLYGFEYKWDGERAIYYWDGRGARIESRNLLDITAQYPELEALGRSTRRRSIVLDGEIVAVDARGRVSFEQLQQRMHVVDAARARKLVERVPVIYMIFDLLYLDGRRLMSRSYRDRRAILEDLALADRHWQTPPSLNEGGPSLLQTAGGLGLEGVLAKRLDSPYEPGRCSGVWLKIKVMRRQEFLIAGYLPGKGALAGRLGALLIGYYDPPIGQPIETRTFHFAGRVGTGFSDKLRDELQKMLDRQRIGRSPFSEKAPPGAVFCHPRLVCEVEFLELTSAGMLRQPSYKGLRRDKDPGEVVLEREAG